MSFILDKEHPLIQAAAKGDRTTLQKLVEQDNIKIDQPGSNGWTALAFAATQGHVNVIRYCVSKRANINQGFSSGNLIGLTPLALAVLANKPESVKTLIDCGADFQTTVEKTVEKNGESEGMDHSFARESIKVRDLSSLPVPNPDIQLIFNNVFTLMAITKFPKKKKNIEALIRECLKNGASVNQTDRHGNRPLHYAAKSGNVEAMQVLLKERAEVNSINRDYVSPLLMACRFGTVEGVQLLITSKANVLQKDIDGNGALMMAAGNQSDEVLRFLIETCSMASNVNHNGSNRYDDDLVIMAARHGNLQGLEYLLSLGYKVNHRNHIWENAFLAAAGAGCLSVLKFLHKREKTLISSLNIAGMNALMFAADSGSARCVKFLLNCGIDLAAKSNDDVTAEEIAEASDAHKVIDVLNAATELMRIAKAEPLEENAEATVEQLLKKGASVHQYRRGKTPLHLAVKSQNLKVLRALLVADADVLAPTRDMGMNAIQLATSNKHFHILACCLLQKVKAAIKSKDEKSAVEALNRAFEMIASIENQSDRETAYFYLGHELKNELRLSDYACKALKRVSEQHPKFKEANQELAELFFYGPQFRVLDPIPSLDEAEVENDLKSRNDAKSREENRFKALEFALQTGHEDMAVRFRTQLVNTIYGAPLSQRVGFADLAKAEAIVELVKHHLQSLNQNRILNIQDQNHRAMIENLKNLVLLLHLKLGSANHLIQMLTASHPGPAAAEPARPLQQDPQEPQDLEEAEEPEGQPEGQPEEDNKQSKDALAEPLLHLYQSAGKDKRGVKRKREEDESEASEPEQEQAQEQEQAGAKKETQPQGQGSSKKRRVEKQ